MVLRIFFYFRKWRAFAVLTGILMFFVNVSSFGQEVREQVDTLRVGEDYVIEKSFRYSISRGDTIFTGPYKLKLMPELSGGFRDQPYHFGELEANFEEDSRHGDFSLQTVSLLPEVQQVNPVNGYIQIPYSGIINKSSGQFEEGLAVGPWAFLQLEREAGAVADTIIQLQAFFGVNGILRDRFRLIDRKNAEVIAGSFDQQGAFNEAVDVRSREDGELLVSLIFKNGLLMAIQMEGKERLQADYHADIKKIEFVEQPLDSLYPKIMSYYFNLPENEWEEVLLPLKTINTSFRHLEGEFSPLMEYLPGESKFRGPIVKVPLYETTEEEREIVQRKHERIKELNRQINDLLKVSAFALNRSASKELSSLYARVQVVKDRLSYQQELSRVLAGPLLPHIDPDWFIERRLAEVERLDTAVYTFNGRQFREPMDFSFETEGMSAFEQYRSYITVLEKKFLEFNEQVSQVLKQVELDTHLSENEEKLSSLSVEIDQLADSIEVNMYSEEASNNYKRAFVAFKDSLLKAYADMEPREQKSAIEALISCLEQMKDKLKNAYLLAAKEKAVDEAYMGTHLNPYTYTEEDERLFERLFSAYRDVIVPFLVEKMGSAENCENFLDRAENIERVQDFMLKALNEKPGRMERRIRNMNDPEAIIRKLEIPVVL